MRVKLPRVRVTVGRLMIVVAIAGVFLWASYHLFVRLPAQRAARGAIDYHRYHAYQCEYAADRPENVQVRPELLALSAWHLRRAEEMGRLDPMSIPREMLDRDRRESQAWASRIMSAQQNPPAPPPD